MDELRLRDYEVGDAPHDLANRVFAQIDAQPQARQWPWAMAVAAVCTLTLGLGWRNRGGEGRVSASERTSITLANRGIAVAESGAKLHWQVAWGGQAEVTQDTGAVFYRVERGGVFEVKTPAGSIRVHGTCFKVEVGDMGISKDSMRGAVIGAGVVAAAWVTVYEGKVSLAQGGHEVALIAGQRGVSSTGQRPHELGGDEHPSSVTTSPLSPEASPREVLARDAEQRREILALREKLRTAGVNDGEIAAADKAIDKSNRRENPVDPSKEELLDLAKKCRLGYDLPTLSDKPSNYGTQLPRELGLTDEEQQAVSRAHQKFNDQTIAQLRSLYTEITGDEKTAAVLSPSSLQSEITSRENGAAAQLVFKRLSAERAGLLPVSHDPAASALERYYRLLLGAGEAFEHELASVIGPDRAHDARTAHGGWNSKYGNSPGCPEQK